VCDGEEKKENKCKIELKKGLGIWAGH